MFLDTFWKPWLYATIQISTPVQCSWVLQTVHSIHAKSPIQNMGKHPATMTMNLQRKIHEDGWKVVIMSLPVKPEQYDNDCDHNLEGNQNVSSSKN